MSVLLQNLPGRIGEWVGVIPRAGYQHVAQGEGEKSESSVGKIVKGVAARSAWIFKGCALLLTIVLVYLGIRTPTQEVLVVPVIPQAQYLHVLIPATHKDVNLCKTLFSAAALNYPVPTLLNWNTTFDDSSSPDGGSHQGKISAVIRYLESLGSERKNDLVLIVDGYDLWFQLRPGVLVERFFDINARANARIEGQMGKAAVAAEEIKQKIVFSTQKRCSPRDKDDPACFAVPESMLSSDISGNNTGMTVLEGDIPYLQYRQQFLNTGVSMGDVASMRTLFSHAKDLMNQDRDFGTDQDVFARILGEQEYQREVIKDRFQSAWQRFQSKWFGKNKYSVLDPHSPHRKMARKPGSIYEFGMGLDYESLLGHATVFAEYDSRWIRYNDTAAISQANRELKIKRPRVQNVPADILRSPPPFWTQNPGDLDLPANLHWGNVPLYTNMYTGVVPATIHHNANIHNLKSLRESAWNETWYQPYIRQLLDEHLNEPHRPFATLREGEQDVAWWSMHEQKWRVRTAIKDNEWLMWDDLCGGHEDEVFRDGKGPWKPPRMDY